MTDVIGDLRLMQRLHDAGLRVEDFNDLAPGLIVVEGLIPPEQAASGLVARVNAKIPVQFCLAHRVVAVGPGVERCAVGDIVKVKEAHLDPLDHKNTHASIEAKWVKWVFRRGTEA